jgi:hypothetical protein
MFITELIVETNQTVTLLPNSSTLQGRIQDFKLGGPHLKKLRRAEGGSKKHDCLL